MTETKTDLKREYRHFYTAPTDQPELVEVPPLQYLMLDGQGNPETSGEYMDAIGALYSVSYTLKFAQKAEGHDFTVMPLEGLWWADDPDAFLAGNADEWRWTAMILIPASIQPSHVDRAIQEAMRKKAVPAAERMRLEILFEKTAAQVMHIGPYAQEHPTIEKLHAFIWEKGYALRDKHHEVYLSDPRRTEPEKMKTLIRQPVA
jgi:hypothetical protein